MKNVQYATATAVLAFIGAIALFKMNSQFFSVNDPLLVVQLLILPAILMAYSLCMGLYISVHSGVGREFSFHFMAYLMKLLFLTPRRIFNHLFPNRLIAAFSGSMIAVMLMISIPRNTVSAERNARQPKETQNAAGVPANAAYSAATDEFTIAKGESLCTHVDLQTALRIAMEHDLPTFANDTKRTRVTTVAQGLALGKKNKIVSIVRPGKTFQLY